MAGLGGSTGSNAAMMRSLRGSAHAALSGLGSGECMPDGGGVGRLVARSSGSPLPGGVAARMGAALGHPLSGVTVHTDAAAIDAAEALNAHAFALGAHLFFGSGAYAPGTPEGDELLLHELQHVVQHDQGRLPTGPDASVSSPSDPSEVEARRVAREAMGAPGAVGAAPGPASTAAAPAVGVDGPAMRNPLGDALDAVGEQVGGGLITMVRTVSPELADGVEDGIGGIAEELLGETLESFIGGLVGDLDFSAILGELTSEVQGIFTVIQGVVAGDPSCCETFDTWMQTLSDFMTRLNDNPVALAIREVMTTVGGVLGDMIALFAGAQLKSFLTMVDGAQAAWDGYTSVVRASQDAVRGLADQVWDGVCELLGLPNTEGNIVDWLLAEAQTWFSEVMAEEGPGILDGLQAVGRLWWENSQLEQFYDLIQAVKAVWEAGSWLWEHWGSPTMTEDAASAGPLVQGFLVAFEAVKGHVDAFGTWAGEFFPAVLEQVQGFAASVGLGWMGQAMEALAAPLLLPIQLGVDFAGWLADGGVQTLSDWASAVWSATTRQASTTPT